ncbi:hypothetical protein TNIN_211841 [Trichonephila inaurata madagascariensis]|uniref:Uncharacterized protein n=1 Tax=Trichonephila inaurata madagascariensis TaxID=2747483 RepID=A0A8X6X7B6_9ARAC|nr:hypothetical protein TNIN_211841 [Trichonephila inaurata madagascariensis]
MLRRGTSVSRRKQWQNDTGRKCDREEASPFSMADKQNARIKRHINGKPRWNRGLVSNCGRERQSIPSIAIDVVSQQQTRLSTRRAMDPCGGVHARNTSSLPEYIHNNMNVGKRENYRQKTQSQKRLIPLIERREKNQL